MDVQLLLWPLLQSPSCNLHFSCTPPADWDVSLSFCVPPESLCCAVLCAEVPDTHFTLNDSFLGNLPHTLLLSRRDLLLCFSCFLLLLTFHNHISLLSFYPPLSSQLTAKAFSFISSSCFHILLSIICLLLLHSCLLELSLFCCL